MKERRALVDHEAPLSVRRQCELLRVSRSGLYYEPLATSAEELELMRTIDEVHLKRPFYGSRKMSEALRAKGQVVNRKRVQRLMRLMGIEALVPKPSTSTAAPEHPRYPYLLRNLAVTRPNQVWAADITYVLRVPAQPDHRFRSKLITDSGHADHRRRDLIG